MRPMEGRPGVLTEVEAAVGERMVSRQPGDEVLEQVVEVVVVEEAVVATRTFLEWILVVALLVPRTVRF